MLLPQRPVRAGGQTAPTARGRQADVLILTRAGGAPYVLDSSTIRRAGGQTGQRGLRHSSAAGSAFSNSIAAFRHVIASNRSVLAKPTLQWRICPRRSNTSWTAVKFAESPGLSTGGNCCSLPS